MAEQKSSSALTAPLRGAASALRRVPGAGMVGRAAEETLDKVGAVSPRGRRIAVYAGAGVLGAAGVVEWPVALTGAAVAWLTQPRPRHPVGGGNEAGQSPEPAHDLGSAALRSGHGGGSATDAGASAGPWDAGAAEAGVEAAGAAEASGESPAAGGTGTPGSTRTSGSALSTRSAEDAAGKPSTGPLGPTARPDRTTL
ncbi:hypothetical protein ACIBJF_32105 [Streptomyces sp. NPDC050743]|uniref:hypothetical protein n=1 Tax=Streptomyces sp. NPDC050743 TaxID=3365634 RepID=UPI00378762B7